MNAAQFKAVKLAIDFLRVIGVKTFDYFGDVIDRLIKSLYNGNIDVLEFASILSDLLDGQLYQAWVDGMAKNGLTEQEFTQEMQATLDSIITDEKQSIVSFADKIVERAAADTAPDAENGLDGLLAQGDLWNNRYIDVENQAALVTAEPEQNFIWRLGNTEKHCDTCAALDGQIASAAAWNTSNYQPQSPPNNMLDCGGWRCDCRLEPTNEEANVEIPSA